MRMGLLGSHSPGEPCPKWVHLYRFCRLRTPPPGPLANLPNLPNLQTTTHGPPPFFVCFCPFPLYSPILPKCTKKVGQVGQVGQWGASRTRSPIFGAPVGSKRRFRAFLWGCGPISRANLWPTCPTLANLGACVGHFARCRASFWPTLANLGPTSGQPRARLATLPRPEACISPLPGLSQP